MSGKRPSNLKQSVRQRLLNLARDSKRPFNELLQRYAMERFLYRLASSPYSDRFVLKGALLLTIWDAPLNRPTRDIDLLGRTANTHENLTDIFYAVCEQEVFPDGMEFEPSSVEAGRIQEQAEYEGIRIRLKGTLGTARVTIQLDVGFGDAVVPGPTVQALPTVLDFQAPMIACYSRDSVVAEKLHVMVRLGLLNSRMKDFWDVWLLSRHFSFDGETLVKAVKEAFRTRSTSIKSNPIALTREFADDNDKKQQWNAFLRRSRLDNLQLKNVIDQLATFCGPILNAAKKGEPIKKIWPPSGPWQTPF